MSMAPAPVSGRGSGRGGGYEVMLEGALIAVTVVVAAGMSRLFTDTSFLRDVLALALASHVVAATTRRVGLRAVGAAAISVASVAITATVLLYTDTAWFIVPTPDTVSAALDHLVEAWDVVNGSPAPVVPVPGLVLTAGTALGLCALLADAAAFRLRSGGWAVAPAATIYGFTAAVGTGDSAVLYGALACGAIGLTMVALWLRSRRAEVWIEAGPGRGTMSVARVAGAALLVAVVAGAVAGPALPGARAEPWIDLERLEVTDAAPWVDAPPPNPEPWADLTPPSDGVPASLEGSDAGPRVLVSPLVQVRSRLVDLSDVELFAVAVPEDERQYWRLTSLDEFDGDAWRARSQYEEVTGPLAATLDPAAASGPHLSQTVMLTGLGNSYLPAAYELRRVIDDGGVAMEYEALSGSLIKARRAALAGPRRFTYAVDSAVPAIGDPDRLRRSETSMLEEGFLATNTQLPNDVQQLVGPEAERITANARSDYHRALLLQDHLRLDGGFRYDLQVHSEGIDGLEDFLFDVRAGYCQQFASGLRGLGSQHRPADPGRGWIHLGRMAAGTRHRRGLRRRGLCRAGKACPRLARGVLPRAPAGSGSSRRPAGALPGTSPLPAMLPIRPVLVRKLPQPAPIRASSLRRYPEARAQPDRIRPVSRPTIPRRVRVWSAGRSPPPIRRSGPLRARAGSAVRCWLRSRWLLWRPPLDWCRC